MVQIDANVCNVNPTSITEADCMSFFVSNVYVYSAFAYFYGFKQILLMSGCRIDGYT